jgi:ATP-dependent Clp protease ATP-binding subunit ClpA
MSGFGNYVHAIVDRAGREAREDGSTTTEAQHLLLAIAAEPEPTMHEVLTSAGLDLRAIREALDREFERSLSAAGISLAAFDLPLATPGSDRPRLGASAKLALERGFSSVARRSDLRPAHLLLGILQAQVGTVPRALDLARVDRSDLRGRVLQTLSDQRG